LKKSVQPALAQLRALARRAHADGSLVESDVDEYLASSVDFEERAEALLEMLGDLPILSRPPAPVEPSPSSNDRPRVPAMADDDNLRRYLRQVRSLKRMEREEEVLLAKRLEFARRRFRAAVAEARLRSDHLRSVLGGEFSRTCVQDLRPMLASRDGGADTVGESRRRRIRTRAAEMNRVRAVFVERNLGIVADLALCYRTYGVPLMDLIQEGNGALIRAVEKFDWRKEVRFQTYATFWIRQAVERSIAFNKGIVRVPNYLQQKMRRLRREGVLPKRDRTVSVGEVSAAFDVKREVAGHLLETERTHYSLDVQIDEDGETFASLLADDGQGHDLGRIEFSLLQARIGEVMSDLQPLEREILDLRFGLSGQTPATLEEVGRRMNVSRERIRQIQVRAIRKLQRPTLLKRLAGFV
jgi:RNA polymerase primary sigma factor